MPTPPEVPGKSRTFWLTFGIALLIFGLIAADVACHGQLARWDLQLLIWLNTHEPWSLVHFLSHLTKLGDPIVIVPVGILVGALLLVMKRWADLVFWAAGLAGSWAITMGLKTLFARPRPVELAFFPMNPGYSFPSGHTIAIVVSAGLAGHLVGSAARRQWPRLFLAHHAATLCALGGGIVVGISLVAVCVHYPTDVLAGLALGWAWVLVCGAARDALYHAKTRPV